MIVSVLPVHLCCPGISVSHYHRCCGPDLGLYIVSVVALLTSSLQFFDQWLHCGCWNRCGNPLSIKLVRLYTNADLLLFICKSGLVFCRLRLWWNGEEVPWDSGCEIWWRRTASRVQVRYCLSHCTVVNLPVTTDCLSHCTVVNLPVTDSWDHVCFVDVCDASVYVFVLKL